MTEQWSMKAWILHKAGDLRYEDAKMPVPSNDEVLVKVAAAGICGSDISRVYKDGAHNMPLIPGHEFSGIVEDVGKDVDGALIGKRVGVFPLIPCGKCGPCKNGTYELCRDYDYLGSRRDGGFAEYVCVPAGNIIELPDEMSYEEAAMLEPMAVAVHAMRSGLGKAADRSSQESVVVVCGFGAIGSLLAMFLMDAGFTDLYVIGNKESQKQCAVKLGISKEHFCDSSLQDPNEWLQDKTNGSGIDLYFECVGTNSSLCYGINASAPEGVIVTVGNPAGDMLLRRNEYWKILRNQLVILGTWNSSFKGCAGADGTSIDDWHYAISRVSDGRVRPAELITHRLSLDELDRGLLMMRDKTQSYCKVMIDILKADE